MLCIVKTDQTLLFINQTILCLTLFKLSVNITMCDKQNESIHIECVLSIVF